MPDLLPEPPHSLDPVGRQQQERQAFDPDELADVLSRYDLGRIEQIRVYPYGSRQAPKVRITTSTGRFLLKRRAPGRDDPRRVAFAHGLLLYLADRGYPVSPPIRCRAGGDSLLAINGRIYELFAYVRGDRDDGSPASAAAAGEALGSLNRLLFDHRLSAGLKAGPLVGSYHAAAAVGEKLQLVPAAVAAFDPGTDRGGLQRVSASLLRAYRQAAQRAGEAGFAGWPKGIIHGDWHPGNLLYADGRVVAVLDFDSARLEPRVADVANAALQFSMRYGSSADPRTWPPDLDFQRFRSLLCGVDRTTARIIEPDELLAIPWLMIEALVVESIVPIAATGSFGGMCGLRFLEMAQAKADFIARRAKELAGSLKG
ncbi:MAG: phosphotransferase [Planctomycetes bacterium]|nr:phosphotransferase [Planctomycetota bacterium]